MVESSEVQKKNFVAWTWRLIRESKHNRVALYPEVSFVLCLVEYGHKVNKRKGMRFVKISLIIIGSRDRKRYLVSIYRLCRKSSLVARSRVSQVVPIDVSSDRNSKLQSAADRFILGLSMHHRLVEDRFTRSLKHENASSKRKA